MAVPAAFSDLMEISSQVEAAIVLDGDKIVVSSLSAKDRSDELAAAIRRLVETAEKTRAGLTQLEVALPEGHLFVVRGGARLIGAATSMNPPSGLVFYDLRLCLSSFAAESTTKSKAKTKSDA
jgi:hypothetical protein